MPITTKMAPHTSHELENTIRCPRTPAITCIHTYVQICSHLVCEHAVRRTLWQLHACYGAQGNVPGWEHCPAYLPPTPAKVRAAQTRTKVAAPTLRTQSRWGHAGTPGFAQPQALRAWAALAAHCAVCTLPRKPSPLLPSHVTAPPPSERRPRVWWPAAGSTPFSVHGTHIVRCVAGADGACASPGAWGVAY